MTIPALPFFDKNLDGQAYILQTEMCFQLILSRTLSTERVLSSVNSVTFLTLHLHAQDSSSSEISH